MCEKCFLRGTDKFVTWQDFEAFTRILQNKLVTGQLKLIEKPVSISYVNDFTTAEAYYKCSSCQETWALSSPDNAWRGYFLPLEQANAYTQRIKTSDRVKSAGCLVLIVAVLLFALWKAI